jgi:CHRD domain/PEP-CTERM motif
MRRSLIPSLAAAAAVFLAGEAHAVTFVTSLTGPAESPPNASPGIGTAVVTINDVTNIMDVNVSFSGLLGTTTASHIHCCTAVPGTGTAIVATEVPFFDSFPIGVTSGSYIHQFDLLDLASYNPAFANANGGTAAGAEAALLTGLNAGEAYLNIHTTVVPGGEIRGFLTAIPEPGTWALTILGAGLVGAALRRRPVVLVAA